MKTTKTVSITLNIKILEVLDNERGIISRSALIQDLIKKKYKISGGNKK